MNAEDSFARSSQAKTQAVATYRQGRGGVAAVRWPGRPTAQAGRIALWIAASPAYWIDSSRMSTPGPGAWIIMPFPE